MNKSITHILICCFGLVLCYSCAKQKPQLPSNKNHQQVDSTLLKIMQLNQVLSEKSDGELTNHVLENNLNYVRHEDGFWYKMEIQTQHEKIKQKETVEIHYKLFLLNGKLCEDVKQTLTLGKKQTIKAIEGMLLEMRHGEKVRLLAPWYLAYGQAGHGNDIQPYEQIEIELSVN